MKKRIMIASAIVAGGLATVVGTTGVTHAASAMTTAHKTGGSSVTHIRERGHVRLNQAVRDGTITSAQKTAFITEVKKLRAERKSAITSTSTTAQKQAEHATLKSELQSWATSNNFPLAKIFPEMAA